MITIHKFSLGLHSNSKVVPGFQKALAVKEQDDKLQMWCLVDTDDLKTSIINIQVCGTSWRLSKEFLTYEHVDTIVDKNSMVWHVFLESIS